MTLTELDILDLLRYIFKQLWIVLAVMLQFACVSLVICKFIIPPEYTASARVYILNRATENELLYSDLQSSEKLVSDFQILITGQNIIQAVIEELNLDMTTDELSAHLSVSSPNNTRVLQISVRNTNPQLAADITNSILQCSIDQIIPIMEIDALHVVYQAEVPTTPSGPHIAQNTILAGGMGMVLSLAVILLKFAMEQTPHDEKAQENHGAL
ncbi:MAG: Wzz/FepE/Etk N-terminal domain-containing protein [Oscillospiraceae bacterium]|nr:Wzz/FepE/Etk N-terminal domain-containing protein [Oscillospiraceae bacterium]